MRQLIAVDIESIGELPEYALQAYRYDGVKTKIRAVSYAWIEEGTLRTKSDLDPTDFSMLRDYSDRTWIAWNACFDISWFQAAGLSIVNDLHWIDAMLLWRHATVAPEKDKGKRKSYALATAMKEFFPKHAGFKDFTDFQTEDPEQLKLLLNRNRMDAAFTLKLAIQFLEQLSPEQTRAAMIESSCIPLVAATFNRGLKIDVAAARTLRAELTEKSESIYQDLVEKNPEVAMVDLGSPKQLGDLLFNQWGLTSTKKTAKGADSTDKEALTDLADTDARARQLKEYREAVGNCTKFVDSPIESAEYNGDSCTRPQAKIFGTYCVPGDVEVLTRHGWVRLDRWAGGEIVQVHAGTQKAEFLPATRFTGPVASDWVSVDHRRIKCDFTLGHTVPYLAQKTGRWSTTKAESLLWRRLEVPLACNIELSGLLTVAQMRVLAMFQADGYVRPTTKKPSYKFVFVKPRKIERALSLLADAGVDYRDYRSTYYNGRAELTIGVKQVPAWWSPKYKTLGAWILNTTAEGLEAFVEELVHWDGSPHKDGGVKYSSFCFSNLEWVVTAAHLVGKKASIHSDRVSVHISDGRTTAQLKPVAHTTPIISDKRSYCAETQTGFWLARSSEKIFVTGNTGRMTYYSKQGKGKNELPTGIAIHQWPRDKRFRSLICPPEGYTLLEFDFAGQEFRWMAVAAEDAKMLDLCQEGEDAHSYMGARFGGVEYRTLQAQAGKDPEMKKTRNLGKFANLSFQYRISAPSATVKAKTQYGLILPENYVASMLKTYRSTYMGVPRYWDRQISVCGRLGYAETFAGRRVQLSSVSGWERDSASINYPIQGTGADQKYLALAVTKGLLSKYDAHLYMELHDGIFYIVKDSNALAMAVAIKHVLSNLPYRQAWGKSFPIQFPVDCKLSPESWGALEEL